MFARKEQKLKLTHESVPTAWKLNKEYFLVSPDKPIVKAAVLLIQNSWKDDSGTRLERNKYMISQKY